LITVFSPSRGDPDRERGVLLMMNYKICFVLKPDGLFIFGLTQKRSKKVMAALKVGFVLKPDELFLSPLMRKEAKNLRCTYSVTHNGSKANRNR